MNQFLNINGDQMAIKTRKFTKGLKGMVEYDYEIFKSPFRHLGEKERDMLIKDYDQLINTQYNNCIKEIKDNISSFDPLSLICSFSTFYLIRPPGINPEVEHDDLIVQFHVELLQALALKNTIDVSEKKPILGKDLDKVEKSLRCIADTFSRKRMFKKSDDEEENKRLRVIEDFRLHTMTVRNWGYHEQILRIVAEIFEPIDYHIEKETGISVLKILKMYKILYKHINHDLNEYFIRIRQISKSQSLSEIVDLYMDFWPHMVSREILVEISKRFSLADEFKRFIFYDHGLWTTDIYSFSLSDLLNYYPGEIDSNVLKNLIDSWSYEYGALKDYPTEYIFLDNPIWKKPLIKLENNKYCWPILGLFLHICIELMESIFINNENLKKKYEHIRSKYLENAIESLFKQGFPEAKIYKNYFWKNESNKSFENDILVLFESFAIVIEARSGKISQKARRGADQTLERDIKKLLVKPSNQSYNFAANLKSNSKIEILVNNQKVIIDASKIKKVIRLSVTLDLFGPLGSKLPDLYEAGFIKDKSHLSPSMTLADLELLIDLLETYSEKIHYLIFREQFEKESKYNADELDLLVFYMQTCFSFKKEELENLILNIYGSSLLLDNYYLGKYEFKGKNKGRNVPKPRPRRTLWWHDVLLELENRKTDNWIDLGFILLNTPYEAQINFGKNLKQYMKSIKKSQNMSDLKSFSVVNPRNELIIGFVYRRLDKNNRNIMDNIIKRIMKEENLNKALIIGISAERSKYPYNFMKMNKI